MQHPGEAAETAGGLDQFPRLAGDAVDAEALLQTMAFTLTRVHQALSRAPAGVIYAAAHALP